ncbi:MAG: GNAT family N-acetyltransferase [Beijerinckiaceae bacterium]
MDGRFSDNSAKSRFEFDVGGRIAFAAYRRQAGRLVILHVEAPPVLRGTGAAGRLMEAIVGVARAEAREIVPYCGYAAAWLRRSQAA